VVLDNCTLHPELTAGVSGAGYARGQWVEDVDLEEVAGR